MVIAADFQLQVDNEGGISQPSSVKIQVGMSTSITPEVMQCADDSLQTVSEECERHCDQPDALGDLPRNAPRPVITKFYLADFTCRFISVD